MRKINNFPAVQSKMSAADHHKFFRQSFAPAAPRPQKAKVRVENLRADDLYAVGENKQILIASKIDDKGATAANFSFADLRSVFTYFSRQQKSKNAEVKLNAKVPQPRIYNQVLTFAFTQ